MKKYILLIIPIIIFISSLKGQYDIVKKGDKMPPFSIESHVNGNIHSEQLTGKVTLIIIFTTWCPPCQQEMQALQQAIDNKEIPFAKNNPDLVILAVGREHTDEELKTYKEEKQFTFPIYPDPNRDFTGKFAKQNVPRMYLIDRKGEIAYTTIGYSEQEFKQLIHTANELLEENKYRIKQFYQ